MTEAEWLTCADVDAMLDFLGEQPGDRKLRLFAVACVRQVWPFLEDERSRTAVEAVERFADGQATKQQLAAAWDAARAAARFAASNTAWYAAWYAAWYTAKDAARFVAASAAAWDAQCVLLRDVIGNPFRPVACQDAWRTAAVVSLTRTAYDDRDFGLLPILGDALEDAGCTDDAILSHCRSGLIHARGCWVLDSILGKEGVR